MSSALEKLKKAANLTLQKRSVELNDGTEFVFYSKPMTMSERERAQKGIKSDDTNGFALQLLINKACDEAGNRLFLPGEAAALKNEVRDEDMQSLMLAVLTNAEEDEEDMDMKSTRKTTK